MKSLENALLGLKRSLDISDEFAQYTLRSLFFYRKMRELRSYFVLHEVEKLVKSGSSFKWNQRRRIGVSEDAWEVISKMRINPLIAFAHPRVLAEQPRLLYYYRGVALISQKGLGSIVGGNISRIEGGHTEMLERTYSYKLALTLNSLISSLIIASPEVNKKYLLMFFCITTGAQIQGSWVNAVGEYGSQAIKELLFSRLFESIVQVVYKNDRSIDVSVKTKDEISDNIIQVKILRFKNGCHAIFSSEPDISFRDPDNVPLISIEIKAGIDPAAALERLGAAMKSLDNEKALNPKVKTVYVSNCITPEVRNRIDQTNPFDYTFNLGEVLNDDRTRRRFVGLLGKYI